MYFLFFSAYILYLLISGLWKYAEYIDVEHIFVCWVNPMWPKLKICLPADLQNTHLAPSYGILGEYLIAFFVQDFSFEEEFFTKHLFENYSIKECVLLKDTIESGNVIDVPIPTHWFLPLGISFVSLVLRQADIAILFYYK